MVLYDVPNSRMQVRTGLSLYATMDHRKISLCLLEVLFTLIHSGNFIGQKPYKSGSPCSACPSDLPSCDNNLCSKWQELTVIAQFNHRMTVSGPGEAPSVISPPPTKSPIIVMLEKGRKAAERLTKMNRRKIRRRMRILRLQFG